MATARTTRARTSTPSTVTPSTVVTNGNTKRSDARRGAAPAKPITGQRGRELQAYGTIARLPNGLSEQVCHDSVESLNQVLADTITLRDMYKKHHWQVVGETFYQLHLLFDKH